ncbi:uncharacterized protein [Procambarus clarkii]|uniref:uncharacterized protein n=1 Tax=Procambarus clarkii TaxID=6728 RepID=UPI0037444B88
MTPLVVLLVALAATAFASLFSARLHGKTDSYITSEGNSLRVPFGLVMMEVSAEGQDANVTLTQLSRVAAEARRVRQVSWCVTVVVVSDDLAFLTAFAQLSLKGRLLVWSTRLLVVTRLPLHHLLVLRELLSVTNSMLLVVENDSKSQRCSVYIQLPFSPREAQALKVASWTLHSGFALTSSLPFFPDKFSRLLNGPKFVVVAEEFEPHIAMVKVEDKRSTSLSFKGPLVNLLEILASTMNFS